MKEGSLSVQAHCSWLPRGPGHAALGRRWPTDRPPSQGAGDDAGSPGTRSLGSVMEPLPLRNILDARAGFIS